MGRLIDADAFIEYANRRLDLFSDELRTMIEEQPTAYDVEKVVEELDESFFQVEQLIDEDGYKYKAVKVVELDMAIDKVRKGGVE